MCSYSSATSVNPILFSKSLASPFSLKTSLEYLAKIEIDLDGKKHKVVGQDVQFHPVSDRPLHVDFLRK